MAQGIKMYDGETLVYPRTVASEVFTSEGKTVESVINDLKTLTTQLKNSVEQFTVIIDDLDKRINKLEK